MRAVSQKQKDKGGNKCFICGKIGVEQHHSLAYRGRQIDEVTIPLCSYCHRGNNGDIWQDVRDRCELKTIQDNLEMLKLNYPKRNWEQEIKRLCLKVKL